MEREIKVDVHPASVMFPPEMRRWRVTLDGYQHSVHPTEMEAEETAKALRVRVRGGWNEPAPAASRPGQPRGDWKR